MNIKNILCWMTLAGGCAGLLAGENWTVVSKGHHNLVVDYQEEEWSFEIDGTDAGNGILGIDTTVLHLTEDARLSVPANAKFSFLGESGSPVWIAPMTESPILLLMGLSAAPIDPGVFVNDEVNIKLTGIEGPGNLFVYTIQSNGDVRMLLDSTQSPETTSGVKLALDGHDHQNWAFTEARHYELRFQASGQIPGTGFVSSEEVTVYYAVGDIDPVPDMGPTIINEGDTDVALAMVNDELILESFWGITEQGYDPLDVVYQVNPSSQIIVPDSGFEFLGEAGSRAWVAPEQDEPGKLYLAMAAENLPTDYFVDEAVQIQLISVSGPGNFSVYETDAFGSATVNMDSSDGINENDVRHLTVGDHYHLNWGFSEPGTYTVEFQASGVRASDQVEIMSEVTTYTFEVVAPEPVDLRIGRGEDSSLHLVWNTETGVQYQLQSKASGADDWENLGAVVDGNGTETEFSFEPEQSSSGSWFRVKRIWP